MVMLIVIHLVLMMAFTQVLAADEPSGSKKPYPSLGGPQSVENEIESNRATRALELYEIPFLKSYFNRKDELAGKYGLSFGSDYTAVGVESTNSLPGMDDNAAGGIFRSYGAWEVMGRGTDTSGTLTWRFAHHRAYSDTAPSDQALENLGYAGVINPLHDDQGWKLNNLYWRQSWDRGRLVLIGGYHDIADFADVYALTDPVKQFSNLAFLTGAGTMSVPSSGSLGALAGAWFNDNLYFQAGLTDSNGDPTDPLEGFDTFTNDNEYFTHLELGWTTSPEKIYLDNVHLTLWHVDERDEASTEDGWGSAFSFSRWLQDRYLPFLKAGYAHDGSSLLERSISTGIGFQPKHHGSDIGDLFAVGLNWGEPNSTVFGSGLDDQYSIEAFYRWQLSKEFAVTTDVQFIKDPALNPDDDQLWLLGLRARLAL
jgi:porin